MRVLVLSGEVSHPQPMSYGFPHAWDVRTVSLVDVEYSTICEKYGNPRDVAPSDVITFLKRAYDRALAQIDQLEGNIDVIVGIGYGAHVLMNLNASREWMGPSVYILSEGNARYNFVSRPLADEIDHSVRRGESVWISTTTAGDRHRRPGRPGQSRKCSHEKNAVVQISLLHEDWSDRLYTTGLLRTCVDIAYKPPRNIDSAIV